MPRGVSPSRARFECNDLLGVCVGAGPFATDGGVGSSAIPTGPSERSEVTSNVGISIPRRSYLLPDKMGSMPAPSNRASPNHPRNVAPAPTITEAPRCKRRGPAPLAIVQRGFNAIFRHRCIKNLRMPDCLLY